MYFDSVEEIKKIASGTGCAIFVLPKKKEYSIDGALELSPIDGKMSISIEQVRELNAKLDKKQIDDVYVIIRPAEALGTEAANAFLKNLEEPKEKVHFILITDSLGLLLPTIRSRSAIYFLRLNKSVDGKIDADDEIIDLSKKLIVAKPADLLMLAEKICKHKDNMRAFALEILSVAIEMLYKSYFITGKDAFLERIPRFFEAYENISMNGHVKLHLIADLI